MTEKLHFAHGNGFPSPCYAQLLDRLAMSVDCAYVDKIGHDPDYPVTDNWNYLVDEVIKSIKTNFSQPVIGLGHSLGGVLTLLAAIKEPSLFKLVIMIDSPLLGRFKSSMIRLSKSLGLIDKITPAARTRGRRRHWPNRDELTAYLKSRPLFMTFSDACLHDYIDYGFEVSADGYTLRFDRHIEYLIFRTLPHHLPRYEGKLTVPAVLIYGDKSSVVKSADVEYMHKKYAIDAYSLQGTHMLPFENPSAVCELILQICRKYGVLLK